MSHYGDNETCDELSVEFQAEAKSAGLNASEVIRSLIREWLDRDKHGEVSDDDIQTIRAAAWNEGFTACERQYAKRVEDPNWTITRANHYRPTQ